MLEKHTSKKYISSHATTAKGSETTTTRDQTLESQSQLSM